MAAAAGQPMALRRAAARVRGILTRGILTRAAPPRHRGPLPRTPWTTRGPPPEELARLVERRPVREQVELDTITYAGRQHFMPGLARPSFPPWDRGWHDPRHSPGPRYEEMPLYKERGCYICHQGVRMLEGVRQAQWLTKTKLVEGLPPSVLSIVDDPAHQLEDYEERVKRVISHARLWDTTEAIPKREHYCPVLFEDLIHLCRLMSVKYPSLTKRMLARNYKIAATWERESILLQVRGLNGILMNSVAPIPPVASKEEILATEEHVLETFYPISPTIDLQEVNVYQELNSTGFRDGYPYSHPHTLFFLESANIRPKRFRPEQLRAKMLMFAFGNALAKAKVLYGNDPKVLEQPIVVQSVGTDGQLFQFMVFQLNTTDLVSGDGIKNLVWIDSDQNLYEKAQCISVVKKRVVTKPAGIYGFQPDTFKKFLALYLHGTV
ncbi:39S ribosomal protein L37, mitochondrial [Aquila chrysaetos chrysaetos]|uniref:Large ribosomal subunit protein mL37 n=1 Tax=Aquila chrysaetos chrysaetos TaxID=223781 RepID=A0A663FFS7_AQUCH|nr:39S ribosomal protein L37, mitochondrial [Aquila chrysaetos chrysaetos]